MTARAIPTNTSLRDRVSDVSEALVTKFNAALDHVIDLRDESVRDAVDQTRSAHPEATSMQLADHFIRWARQELVVLGAANGGIAALPGLGTGSSLMMSVADLGLTIERVGELILKIGYAYGHDTAALEERRAWILAVLGAATGYAKGASEFAGALGQRGGVRIVKAIPMSEIHRLNRALGGRIVVKWTTKQGVVRLGRLVPFGIGASIGAASNGALVGGVGRTANRFFDDSLPTVGEPAAGAG